MPIADRFKLDVGAELSVTDFRNESLVSTALSKYHLVQVRRRAESLGVLVEKAVWGALQDETRRLQEELERVKERNCELEEALEEAAVAALIAEREGSEYSFGTSKSVAQIARDLEKLDI